MVSPLWKLTKQQAAEVVACYVAGESAHSVAKRYGITLNAVRYQVKKAGVWEGRRPRPLFERFWDKAEKTDSGCWLWSGAMFPNGYPCFSINRGSVGAHRVAYELANGPIPEGLTIDHLCRVKRCVNPDHLEAVAQGENTRRGRVALGQKYELTGKRGRAC